MAPPPPPPPPPPPEEVKGPKEVPKPQDENSMDIASDGEESGMFSLKSYLV